MRPRTSQGKGALRSAFLIQAGLTKESFIATWVVISFLVDIPRIIMYGVSLPGLHLGDNRLLLAAAVLAAFAGAGWPRLAFWGWRWCT